MLQWMGGSRRKVNASKKSTHNKQKHYFEQKKRQQRTTELENRTDVSSKRVHYHEEPRSLDILSFVNLAAVAQQGCSSHSFCFQPEILLPDKCSAVIVPENAQTTQNLISNVEGLKMPASSCEFSSNHTHFQSEEKKEEIQDEVSVLDLLDDDNKEINYKGRAVPETHLAFSVEGLGKVGMETPVPSPRTQIRIFASPPRVTRHVQNSTNFMSMANDLGRELHNAAMRDINKLVEQDSAEVICKRKCTTCEKEDRKTMNLNDLYMYPDVFDNLPDCFGNGNENFQQSQSELWESSSGGMLDDDFPGIGEYDAVREDKSSYSDSHAFVLSNAKRSGIHESGFADFYLDRSRSGTKQQKRFSNSAKRDALFSLSDCNLVSPDNDKSIFDIPSWSFAQKEDLPDCVSSLSQESCSSAAVTEHKRCDLLSHLAKLKEGKKSHLDELDMRLMNMKDSKKNHMDELDMSFGSNHNPEKNYANDMNGGFYEMNLGAGNYKCMSKHLNSKDRYCSKVSSQYQRIADPDCIFPFKEEFSSDFTWGTSKSNIPVDHESFENNISREQSGFAFRSQKPHTHIWMTEGCLPYSFFAGDNQNGARMPDSVRQGNACEGNGELDRTIKPENKILGEKSLYSLSDTDNSEGTPTECLKLNRRIQNSYSEPKANDPPEEAETTSETEEVPRLQIDINDKVDQLDCSSPDPSEFRNEESVKEKLGSEVTIFRSIAGEISDIFLPEDARNICSSTSLCAEGKDFFKQRGAEATLKFNSFHIHLLHRQFVWELNN